MSTAEHTSLSGNALSDNGNGPDTGGALVLTEVNGIAADVGPQITHASGVLMTLNGDGTFEYDPNGAFDALALNTPGTDSFVYRISNGFGGEDVATATVTINGGNDLADFAGALAASIVQAGGGGNLSDPNVGGITGTVTATDVDGPASLSLIVMAVSGPLSATTSGGVTVVGSGSSSVSLTGGADADNFIFGDVAETLTGAIRGQIVDFEQGLDVIVVCEMNLGVFNFVGTGPITGANQIRLIETAVGSSIVQFKIDTDLAVNAEIRIANVSGLTADDYAL